MTDEPILTELAKKYKHPEGKKHDIIKYTGKSGLTPLGPPDRCPQTEEEKKQRDEFEIYQRTRCLGFTVAELVALEAFAPLYDGYGHENRAPIVRAQLMTEAHFAAQNELPPERVDQNPTVPLHPIYQRKNWTNRLFLNRERFFVDDDYGEWGVSSSSLLIGLQGLTE